MFQPQKDVPTCRLITRSGLKALEKAQKQVINDSGYYEYDKSRTTQIRLNSTIDETHLRLKGMLFQSFVNEFCLKVS